MRGDPQAKTKLKQSVRRCASGRQESRVYEGCLHGWCVKDMPRTPRTVKRRFTRGRGRASVERARDRERGRVNRAAAAPLRCTAPESDLSGAFVEPDSMKCYPSSPSLTPDPVATDTRPDGDFNVSQVLRLDALARGTCDEEAFLLRVQMLYPSLAGSKRGTRWRCWTNTTAAARSSQEVVQAGKIEAGEPNCSGPALDVELSVPAEATGESAHACRRSSCRSRLPLP